MGLKVVLFPFPSCELGLMIKYIFLGRLSKFIYLPYLQNTFWHSLLLVKLILSNHTMIMCNDATLRYLMHLQMAMFCFTSNSECHKVLCRSGKYMNLDILLWNINSINNPNSQPRNGNKTTFIPILVIRLHGKYTK